jgi:hypothetical protein
MSDRHGLGVLAVQPAMASSTAPRALLRSMERTAIGDAAWEDPARYAALYRDPANRDAMAEYAGGAWFRWGTSFLGPAAWRDLFRRAGYRFNDRPAERPTEPMMLWRGAVDEHRLNWSWTPKRDFAVWFAVEAPIQCSTGDLWCAVVTPDRLLAATTPGAPNEHLVEYVVDTRGLVVMRDSDRIQRDLAAVL